MFSTPDLKDKYQKKVFQGLESMKSFGNIDSFFGQIKTVTCHDDNSKVKEILGTCGKGKILVINSNSVTHAAMIGDEIAQSAIDNEWSGVFIEREFDGSIESGAINGESSRRVWRSETAVDTDGAKR